MFKKIHFYLLLTFITSSCGHSATKGIISSSGRYVVNIDVNESHNDPRTFGCIRLTLYDNHNNLLSVFQTGASDYSKWAVAWHPVTDTLILNSHDIGTYAYKIVDSKTLVNVRTDRAIEHFADSIFREKYR